MPPPPRPLARWSHRPLFGYKVIISLTPGTQETVETRSIVTIIVMLLLKLHLPIVQCSCRILYYYYISAIIEGWYRQKHTCIVQFKLKFTPSASKPANKLVQLYYLNEPALNAESLLGEVEREKDKSSRCSRDSIQFRPTAAGFHKNAIFNLVSLCILK